MKNLFYFIIFIFCSVLLFSQESETIKPDRKFINQFYDAEAFMYELNYEEALEILLKLENQDPDNANLNYKIGICYLHSRISQNRAEKYLEKASQSISESYKPDNHRERNAPLEALLYLGQAYHYNYKFDEAKDAYNTLLDKLDPSKKINEELISILNREIEVTDNAIEFIANPVDAEIRNLGRNINSDYADHSPVIDMNENYLFFTSQRPKPEEPLYNQDEDIFMSKDENFVWMPAVRIGENINTGTNESVIGISANGETMFFFRSINEFLGKVMITHSDKTLDVWSDPERLGPEINSKYRETHAALSPDGKSLYFVSDREADDAVGGTDIYVMHLLPDNTWSKPKCLPNNINTIYDEETPFVHPDGETMFFSSKGHNSMGGFDVFYTKIISDNKYADPINLGYPINTTGDDVSYVLNMDGRRGYLASVKPEGFGDYDIYEILQNGIYINQMVVFSGIVSDINNNVPDDLKIKVINKNSKLVQGVSRANKDEGRYYLILKPGEDYLIEYDAAGHLVTSIEVSPEKEQLKTFESRYEPIPLDPIALIAYKYQDTAYFETESDVFAERTEYNLDKVIARYNQSEDMLINVNYPVGRETEFLTKQRSDKIVDYLVTNGINERIIYFNGDFPAGYNDVYAIEMSEHSLIADVHNLPVEDSTQSDIVFRGDTVYVDPVYFAFDRYEVQSKYFENLSILAEYMVNNPTARLELAGHTDYLGTHEYNYLLSYRRAKAVKDYLVAKGVKQDNLIAQKYGETEPIAENLFPDGSDNPAGRQYNRRVEFKVLQQGTESLLIPSEIVLDNAAIAAHGGKAINNNSGYSGKYTVQVMALRNEKPVDYFADLVGVTLHRGQDGWFRYYVGEFNSRAEAQDAAYRLRGMGYDPFVRKLSFYK
ncbi:MAG: OmpA family protein [Bacteroidales bacterium]|jgi:outer membrane protein OmpA-like peptidoglycan-associated protein/tetratricopeptide (TPR) repeat protein|nr:OmpA family protein [Bacteroidales bacterium]